MNGVVEFIVFESFLKDACQKRINDCIIGDANQVIVEGVRASDEDRTRGAFIIKLRSAGEAANPTTQGRK
jgi:hypothetical protein